MKRLIFLLFPFLLFSEIIKYENLKPFYYENQIINFNIKIILPNPNKLIAIPSYNVEANLSKINQYIYNINIKFKNTKEPHSLMIIGKNFYKQINLNELYKSKKLPSLPSHFSNVLAKDLQIINPISSKYNNKILLSFIITCKECNLKDFNLTSNENNLTIISKKKATYYLVLPKEEKNYYFYYFNTDNNSFQKINIPIVLKENIISTQIDLTPEENKFFTPLNILILAIIAFFLIIFIVYKRIWILLFPIILGGYLIYQLLPKGYVILKNNAKIKILPTNQSTVIYIATKNEEAKILNKINGYTKIKIKNKIGWIKNEDIK